MGDEIHLAVNLLQCSTFALLYPVAYWLQDFLGDIDVKDDVVEHGCFVEQRGKDFHRAIHGCIVIHYDK